MGKYFYLQILTIINDIYRFEKNEGVIIIAATNMPESLDPALVRPGRFDKQVRVSQ